MLNLITAIIFLQNNINIAEHKKSNLITPNFEYCQNLYFTDFEEFTKI